MKKWWWITFGALCSLGFAAILYWIALPPRGDPIQLIPAPSQSPYEVYVVGAVAHPGVYSLPPGIRVKDVIQSAGGFLNEADQSAVNLAALLIDGDQIRVPTQKVPTPSRVSPAPTNARSLTITPAATAGPININTATLDELATLPGIGPGLASRIIAYRQLNGAFKTKEDLMKVEGIGPVVFSKLKDRITVGS